MTGLTMLSAILLSLTAALGGYLLGSLPLGSLLIKVVTGKNARDFSAHNLGIENLLYFIGAPLALTSFFLDLLKGFLALALFMGNPLAGVGVYAGHLYPLRYVNRQGIPHGRGNGVLTGVLAGFWLASGAAWWLVDVAFIAYAVILAVTGYVALATVGGMALLLLVCVVTKQAAFLTLCVAAITVLALWRHKDSLARIVDKTEARLGDPPPVYGRDPNVILAAFMIHPMTLDDLWQPRSLRWLKHFVDARLLPEAVLKRALLYARPQSHGEIRGIRLKDGRELRVMLVGGPLLPDQIQAYPDIATNMAIAGARFAKERGAEAFGLGAFWSTVGNKGEDVQAAVPGIAITNGGAYTAATVKAAVPGLLKQFKAEGGNLKTATAAVVGANGVVAFGVARMIAAHVGELVLIGRNKERLERSASTLKRKYPALQLSVSTSIKSCSGADLIFAATSDPNPVIYPEHVKPGAWIFDLGRPADVHERVRDVPGVHIIPGGVVRPPGDMRSYIDIHFGEGQIPACMAETMIMTATKAFDKKSLGASTRAANINYYLTEGDALGFEIITRDERVAQPLENV